MGKSVDIKTLSEQITADEFAILELSDEVEDTRRSLYQRLQAGETTGDPVRDYVMAFFNNNEECYEFINELVRVLKSSKDLWIVYKWIEDDFDKEVVGSHRMLCNTAVGILEDHSGLVDMKNVQLDRVYDQSCNDLKIRLQKGVVYSDKVNGHSRAIPAVSFFRNAPYDLITSNGEFSLMSLVGFRSGTVIVGDEEFVKEQLKKMSRNEPYDRKTTEAKLGRKLPY